MDPHAIVLDQDISLGNEFIAEQQIERAVVGTPTTSTVTAESTDVELCRATGAGDIAAFEMLYERFYRRTFSLCLRMTTNQTEAEDLTQEVFVQLYKKASSFRGESAFATWLHRMTVNQVLMHFRRRSYKNEKTSIDGDLPDQIVTGSGNPSKMQIVDRIALNNAIGQLPPGYKKVFLLHDVQGFEHEEVARRMGISVGTSKSQLHKARLKLRTLLLERAQ